MGKLKRVVLIVAAVVGIGAVGAGAVALRTYDQATKIDRTHPEAVLVEYVNAELVVRDEARTELFTCADSHKLAELRALQEQLRQEEGVGGFTTQVTLGTADIRDGGRTIVSDISLSQGSGVEVRTRVQTWRFTLVDEDGWRVCGAEQISTPSPSATPPTAS